ncbi:MAG: FAD-dependent oxidoreductase [Pseudomonadota bacterium]
MLNEAEIVIIGGGIVGLSTAYHLAKAGAKDVVLLERRELTCGTTWHAAGLVTQLRATENMARLAQYTASLFHELEPETGQATGYQQCGSVTIATTPDRLTELKRGASMGRSFGLEVDIISPERALAMLPGLNIEGVLGAAHIPSDGKTNPIDTSRAYAAGAKMNGAKIIENIRADHIDLKNDTVVGVKTDKGYIKCDKVIICGGMWSRDLGQRIEFPIPLHAAEHFYVLTEKIDGLDPKTPVIRSQDEYFYAKEDAGKLLIGGFEPVAKPWGMDGISDAFFFDELPNDFDHMAPILELAIARMPFLENCGLQVYFTGPESFTPDTRFLMGAAAEKKGLYASTGYNSCGIESSGGAGKVMAEWVMSDKPPMDLWEIDVRRMMPFQTNPSYLHDRTVESLGKLFKIHYPNQSPDTARDVRQSPLHDRLKSLGANFAEACGWERANWFAPDKQSTDDDYGFGRQRFFDYVASEHHATREAVTLFDQTSFAHYTVQGPDAVNVLNRISSAELDVEPGKVVYTPWLNDHGGCETDLTIARLARDKFMIVTAGAQAVRDMDWLTRHIKPEERAYATDMMAAYVTLSVMGPNARALMQRASKSDFSDDAFPFGTFQNIDLHYGYALAYRMTFVGELGWELHIPTEFAPAIFDHLMALGVDLGVRPAGYAALEGLRMEAGFRDWGHEITDETTPAEAGIGFTIDWEKTSFNGRDAVLAQKGAPLKKRLVQFALNEDGPLVFGTEPIWRNGRLVGYLRSGAFGHSVGRPLGMGYVEAADGVTKSWLAEGTWEIEVAGERFPASAQLRAFYDPKRTRVKGEHAPTASLINIEG